MNLHQAQSQIASDTHRFRVVNCGRRFGKTTLAVLEMVAKAVYGKDRKIFYVAPTYQQARDIAWQELKKSCEPIIKDVNESRLEIIVNTVDGGTSLISLRGWESIEGLRGQSADFIVIDEIAMMRNFWINWQEVIRPTLTDRKGEMLFISTPKGFNHFYDLYNLENEDDDYKSFHFTSYDNPFMPKEEIDKARKELTEDRFAQEYLADFRKTEGLVYKEFNRDKHLFEEAGFDGERFEVAKTIAGIDFGFHSPCAVLTIQKDTDGVFWITDEWYEREKTDAQIADYTAGLRFNEVYPDPESASGIEELRRRGVNIRDVIKNKDSIRNGINTVRELFKSNRLFIHQSCKNLIWELETYSYPDKKPDKNEEENPIKENDHACFTKDALIDLPFGSILYQKSTGIKDIYEFMGSKVTIDHPYLTPRGFVRLDSLRYSDKIVLWKNKLLTELSLDDTQTQNAVSLKTILYLLRRNLQAIKQNAFIGIYGKNIMEKYLKGFISTIKTITLLTTSYLISNLFLVWNTIKSTIMKCYLNGGKQFKKQFKRLVSGARQNKEKNLEENLGKLTQSIFQDTQSREIATNVEKNILPKQSLENSATIIAKLKHLGKEEVFATVTTNGFFTANGVLVSNCDALRYALMMEPIVKKTSVSIHRSSSSGFSKRFN